VRSPTLAVAAELDLLAPAKAVRAMHDGIADVRFVTIEGAAHSIHWEKPAETAAAINAFLR
jgi:pimeloyl-ACP methyl ester carboxylesterase